MFLNKLLPRHLIHAKSLSTKTITKSTSALFFKPEVQELLLKLTRIDLSKVFRKQKYGQELKPPEYKFLTTEEVEKLKEEAYNRAIKKMQMPPIVPARDDSKLEVLSNDKELLGHDVCKYVFTDITFGISDAKRIIVVREPDGLLREANTNERHRMNNIYFSRPGNLLKLKCLLFKSTSALFYLKYLSLSRVLGLVQRFPTSMCVHGPHAKVTRVAYFTGHIHREAGPYPGFS